MTVLYFPVLDFLTTLWEPPPPLESPDPPPTAPPGLPVSPDPTASLNPSAFFGTSPSVSTRFTGLLFV
ncbi:hypothetical protein ACQKCU_24600 [Heyndrickxia sporothermodurans]